MNNFGDLTEARLERGLMIAAYVVSRHGAKYAPLFERLEREMAEFRKQDDAARRARQYLKAAGMICIYENGQDGALPQPRQWYTRKIGR